MAGRPILPTPPGAPTDEFQRRWVKAFLRHRMAQHEISAEDLADQIGVNRATVYNWMNGRMATTAHRLMYWVFHGDLKDEVYWRERALAAENHLARIEVIARDREEWDDDSLEVKLSA